MDPSNPPKEDQPEEPRYLDFPHLPNDAAHDGKPLLNKYSTTITRDHAFPGAQAMLYAAGVPDQEIDSMHLLDLGKTVKTAVQKQGMLAWQYNTIGVSDAITIGSEAVGYSKLLRKPINIATCYEAAGAYIYNTLTQPDDGGDKSKTKDEIMEDIERHACPGAGACGGMYTANTMATAIETMGLSLPGSSSNPATSPSKMRECGKAAEAIKVCMEKGIKPRDLLTKRSFENALVITMALGGSTNGVVHFLAMAATAGVALELDDFQRVSNKVPFIANLAPSGKYFMADLYEIGGVPSVQKLLIAAGLLDGDIPTVT
ncbi:MAG: hypothetical protein Q9226_007476, partial [Calogaya cf. arnoldii]